MSTLRHTILLVDDDPAIRALMRFALPDPDFRIVEADSAERALEVFQEYLPDITLLDVGLPGLDGFECCRRLRCLPKGRDCAIVMVTALDRPEDIDLAFAAGATDFMTKPLTWRLFNHRVRYMLKANRTLQELRRNQNRLAQAQSIAGLGYWEWDFRAAGVDCSGELYRLVGLPPRAGRLSLRKVMRLVHPEDRQGLRNALKVALRLRQPYDIEYRVLCPDGRELTLNDKTEILYEYGEPYIIGTVLDISEQKRSEKRITYYAYYDPLTKLPNRRSFIEQCRGAITASRTQGSPLALLFIDVDRFKQINDTYGHRVGDKLLAHVAARIKRCLYDQGLAPRSDAGLSCNIARLGGDEFTVLLCGPPAERAREVATQLLECCAQAYQFGETSVYITLSIGLAFLSGDCKDAEALLQHADTAMYHAKQSGRNNLQFFSPRLSHVQMARLHLENDLRQGLRDQDFELLFQPQLNQHREVICCEALLRWRHPERGLIAPDQFMQAAESSGLIIPLGNWVLEEACRKAVEWQRAGARHISVAVNLSALQFNLTHLPEQVAGALRRSGLSPAQLVLEITETAIIKDLEETLVLLNELKGMGVKLAIDDFGMGYSSLNYLKRFPIDCLKIDKSFVEEIVQSRKDAAIVQTILQLAANLDLSAIAEGVETEQQLAALRRMGCNTFQGYLFSRPLPAPAIHDFFAQQLSTDLQDL